MKSLVLLLLLPVVVLAAESKSASSVPQKDLVAEGEPLARTWKPAEFPASVSADVPKGTARVRFVVDEKGGVTGARVVKASHPAFGEAALAAIQQWTFAPGVENGKPAPMCLEVNFPFSRGPKPAKLPLIPPPDMTPRYLEKKGAKLEQGPVGESPTTMLGRGLNGDVEFRCVVTPEGRATDIQIVHATHADYVLPALASSSDWKFTPATQGDLKVSSDAVGSVSFTDRELPPRAKVLEANGLSLADGTDASAIPTPFSEADPVWPYDELMKGEGGAATVEFTVGANGVVRDVKVREASAPSFGAAVAAAMETWVFAPAMSHGRGLEVNLTKHFDFKPVPMDAKAEDGDWQTRLVAATRAKTILGGKGLDSRLTPIYRVLPARPQSLGESEKAQAVIEFVIDRDGRARLPRIVSASNEAYGWAAATAISQWVFRPPTRGGQPTEVRVQLPISL